MGLLISLMPAFVPALPWAYGGVTGFVGYWVFYFLSQLLSPVLFPQAYNNLDKDPHKNRGYQAEWDTRWLMLLSDQVKRNLLEQNRWGGVFGFGAPL